MFIADQRVIHVFKLPTMSATTENAPAAENGNTTPTCIDRVTKLPVVEIALLKSAGIYEMVKGSSNFAHWTLSHAEAGAKMGMDMAAPVIEKLHTPISAVDHTICKGLDYVESKFPCVKEQAHQIVEDVKIYSLDKVALAKGKAQLLADLSWQKANDILATRYGDIAFRNVNASTLIAEQYFDYYFPPTEEEKKAEVAADSALAVPTSDPAVEDRVLQTVHTVGRVSGKMAHRIYRTLADQMSSISKENAHEYVRSLVALLTLKNYVSALEATEGGEDPEEKPGEKKPKG